MVQHCDDSEPSKNFPGINQVSLTGVTTASGNDSRDIFAVVTSFSHGFTLKYVYLKKMKKIASAVRDRPKRFSIKTQLCKLRVMLRSCVLCIYICHRYKVTNGSTICVMFRFCFFATVLKSSLMEKHLHIRIFFLFNTHLLSSFLDKPWSQVSSLLSPGSCLQFLSRIGFSNPTARRFFIECC